MGNPNVGKSTLMNALMGERLAIVTPRAQTTRHRILGILNGENHQIVFSDLPGILEPHYRLQEKMLSAVESAMEDADLFLYMAECGDKKFNETIVKKILDSAVPVIVVLNKVDTTDQEIVKSEMKFWEGVFPEREVIPVSVKYNFNLERVMQSILQHLPEHPPYFAEDELTDRSERFFVSEIIREKILLNYRQEIPYSVEVVVDSFRESEEMVRIEAMIYVNRDSQKAILIGKEGKAIKKAGTDARIDIEKFLNRKVFLELRVKVRKGWRDSDLQLKRFGYD